MNSPEVTDPRFASALEGAILRVTEEHRLVKKAVKKSMQLRAPNCGIASLATAEYLHMIGKDSQLLISRPHLNIDPHMAHVMVLSEGKIVDTTFSQFFNYVGLNENYVEQVGVDEFPDRKIAVFSEGNGFELASWVTKAALHFQRTRQKQADALHYRYNIPRHAPLATAPPAELQSTYAAIWRTSNISSYRHGRVSHIIGKQAAEYIAKELL